MEIAVLEKVARLQSQNHEKSSKRQKRGSGRRRNPLLRGADYSVDVFLKVWDHLEKLCKEKEKFALRWLLKEDIRLKLFLSCIGDLELERFSRGLLLNGYYNCKKLSLPLLSGPMWKKADSLFASHLAFKCVPKPVKEYIEYLSKPDLLSLREKREKEWKKERHYSSVDVEVKKISEKVLKRCEGCFLGKWEKNVLDRFEESVHDIFRSYPRQFFVMKRGKHYTSFYDYSGDEPLLVAMVISRGDQFNSEVRLFIRTLMEELFLAHPKIYRAVADFESSMVGFGPLFNRFKKGKDKVSFYTSILKVKDLLKSCSSGAELQNLIDRHAPIDFVEILLALYLWLCPELLKSFFEYSHPYLEYPDCDSIDFEDILGSKGPPAYQLYITKDYCSKMHTDSDATEFTLCYVSHPDAEMTSPVDFALGGYGCCLPLGDTDLFAFRSSQPHAIGYRSVSSNAAYVGCMAVNSRLRNLMVRRRAI